MNFLDWSEQKGLVGNKMLEAEIKKSIDSNLCSMGRQKKGKTQINYLQWPRIDGWQKPRKRSQSHYQSQAWGQRCRLRGRDWSRPRGHPRGTNRSPH